MNINESDINSKTGKIFLTSEMMDIKINQITKKIEDINTIYINYEFNKNLKLKLTTSYLKFQVDILLHEKKYYKKIKTIFIKKFVEELYNISEFIILILISLDNLDINKDSEKKAIMNKILRLNKMKKMDNGKISELINITLNNLRLTHNFIKLFEDFIVESENENIRKNFHTKNFRVNLMNKKRHIEAEYIKYCEQLIELVEYFFNFSERIDKQLDKQELLQFTLKKDLKK
jgi:hypothetical protein